MKKGLLAVSFGTSHVDTLQNTIAAIENTIANGYSERKLYRAFTSGFIIRKLKKTENLEIDTVEQALSRMLEDGIEDIVIQPTYVLNGEEFDMFCGSISKYEEKFKSMVFGKPMLTTSDDYKAAALAVLKELPEKDETTCYVFMGHGTYHHANAAYPMLEYVFHDLGRDDIIVGTVEGYPGIDEVQARLKERPSVQKVCCYPFLIVAGDHAKNDLAGDEEDSWKCCLQRAGYQVACHLKGLGEYQGIQEIFLEHARAAEIKE